MKFSIDDGLFELFPGLRIGCLICRIDNSRYGKDLLEGALEAIQKGLGYEKPQDHPRIRVWREAFAALRVSPSKYQSSVESLVRRALKGGFFPRVNPLVDLYNALSLEFLVPVGGHDLGAVEGDLRLGFASGTETFTPIEGGEEETAEEGEVIYRDDKSVLTRRWVWRQSNKDRVTARTRCVFIPIDVLDALPPTMPGEVMDRFDDYFRQNGTGEIVYGDMLSAQKRSVEFTF